MGSSPKIALVTGAGSGIGKCVSVALAQNGYSLVLAGRRMERLETTVAAVKQANADTQVIAVPANVTEPASVAALFAKTKETFGRLDLLFNNAGFGGKGVLLEDMTFEQWKAVIDTNLTGAFLCTQQAFKIMKDQDPRGGRIINNGSVGAHSPRPNSAPYTSSKHGITGLTKSTSLDGRKYDIACGQIDIGNAATELTGNMSKGVPQANGTRAPEPTMDPQDVARAVVYMASLPLEANVQFMLIMATKMPLIGRG
jgi:NAD(P)-dependent dehydrogenase (short-subunit alcohol dehydrogenase family)